VYNDTKNTLDRSSKSISLRTFLGPLGDFLYIFSCTVKKLWVGRVKKWGILILKTHTSLTSKEK
jgi:hypothetical protein